MKLTLSEIAVKVGAEIQGDGDTLITGVAAIEAGESGCIGFLANPKYKGHLADTALSAVIVTPSIAEECNIPALLHRNPYATYARVAQIFDTAPKVTTGIHPNAVVADSASLGKNVSIAAGVVIEDGAELGDGVVIGANSVIAAGCKIGSGTRIYPNVTLYHFVELGKDVVIHANATIGADGFGFAPDAGGWEKVPQLGSVIIGDNSDIGANTCIDRGALSNTIIGQNVKIDNQVQIGHNVQIGDNTVIAGCAAIAGSAKIGAGCMLGGGVGIAGHIDICDGVIITGGTNILTSVRKSGSYSSGVQHDATPLWLRNAARFKQLDKIAKRLTKLEKQVDQNGADE